MKKTTVLAVLMMMFVTTMAIAGVKMVDKTSATVSVTNEIKCGYGLDCAKVSGNQKQVSIKPSMGSGSVFTSGDTTPAVDSGGPFFKTYPGNTVTITDFDGTGIYAGQEIIVKSQGPVTYDVTSSGLLCGTTDLSTTASGDMTKWMYDGTDWNCEYVTKYSGNRN